MLKISVKTAREPLPEKGLIKTNLVSSFGIPSKLKKGDKRLVIKLEIPLTSNNSQRIKMATRYGKIPITNGTEDLTPSTKQSYGLTFFIVE